MDIKRRCEEYEGLRPQSQSVVIQYVMDYTGRYEASGDSTWTCRRKTLPCRGLLRSTRAHRRRAKVRIGPPRRLRTPSAAMRRAPVVTGSALPRGAPFARRRRGESLRGLPAGRPASPAPRCVSGRLAGLRTPRGSGPRPEGSPARSGASSSRIPASGSPGPDASAQPLITARARSISREVRATATTSTDRPSLWSACQSPRCAAPQERSAVEVSWPGST